MIERRGENLQVTERLFGGGLFVKESGLSKVRRLMAKQGSAKEVVPYVGASFVFPDLERKAVAVIDRGRLGEIVAEGHLFAELWVGFSGIMDFRIGGKLGNEKHNTGSTHPDEKIGDYLEGDGIKSFELQKNSSPLLILPGSKHMHGKQGEEIAAAFVGKFTQDELSAVLPLIQQYNPIIL